MSRDLKKNVTLFGMFGSFRSGYPFILTIHIWGIPIQTEMLNRQWILSLEHEWLIKPTSSDTRSLPNVIQSPVLKVRLGVPGDVKIKRSFDWILLKDYAIIARWYILHVSALVLLCIGISENMLCMPNKNDPRTRNDCNGGTWRWLNRVKNRIWYNHIPLVYRIPYSVCNFYDWGFICYR